MLGPARLEGHRRAWVASPRVKEVGVIGDAQISEATESLQPHHRRLRRGEVSTP